MFSILQVNLVLECSLGDTGGFVTCSLALELCVGIRNHNCVCQEGCVYVQAVAKILRSQCESNII